jgi:hypothetical protein
VVVVVVVRVGVGVGERIHVLIGWYIRHGVSTI